MQRLNEPADLDGIGRRVVHARDAPIFALTREHRFPFRPHDGDAIENIGVDPNEMPVAQVVRFCVQNLLDFFWQRVNEATRSESNVDLSFLLFRHSADLEHLTLFATGRIRPTDGLIVLAKQGD